MPWLLIIFVFLTLNMIQGYLALACMIIGIVMLIERVWPEKWENENSCKVDEAAVLSRFPDASDQTVIAGLFHTLDPASTATEREKAVRETLLKVYQAAADPSSEDLKAAVIRKNKEAELRKLTITLN